MPSWYYRTTFARAAQFLMARCCQTPDHFSGPWPFVGVPFSHPAQCSTIAFNLGNTTHTETIAFHGCFWGARQGRFRFTRVNVVVFWWLAAHCWCYFSFSSLRRVEIIADRTLQTCERFVSDWFLQSDCRLYACLWSRRMVEKCSAKFLVRRGVPIFQHMLLNRGWAVVITRVALWQICVLFVHTYFFSRKSMSII